MKQMKWKYYLILALIICLGIIVKPSKVTGEIKPIEEINKQLAGISEEEQETLERLFIFTQEIEEMEREEARISEEINQLHIEIEQLDNSILIEQENYDLHLDIMEKVLVSYQRGGPASYLDIILKAENLTSFIKSLNLIKDISRNTGKLLSSIEESKLLLEEKKQSLSDSIVLLEVKKEELQEPIANRKRLVEEQESYLNSLAEEKELYRQHLDNLKLMWDSLKEIFSEIVDEFSRIIGEGHFTMEDLNLKFDFFSLKGAIHQDTFNRIMNDNSNLPEIVFGFDKDGVRIEVPDNNLFLDGYFVLEGSAGLLFVPKSGSFYGMTLESESIDELFREGPLLINFEQVTGDMVTIEIKLKDMKTEEGFIHFTIDTGFLFY